MFPDPNDNIIQLSDRIKELSYTVGTNNMVLENAAPGFSRFGDFYQQSGLVFYAITDGAEYEVGSGHYLSSTLEPFYSSDQLRRYPFRSTNNNTKVDWAAGTKEVFVTYPAPFTVMTAYGVDDRFKQPERSGIAFWDNDGVASGTNILNYDSSGNWDKDNHRLGLHTFTPGYAIDIEGPSSYSIVKASGLRLDSSGIIFSGGYDGHGQYSTRQLDPFLMNQVDAITGSNAVIDVSGWVNESIILKTQAAGQVFSGPLNDCVGGCDDGYPAFRVLHTSDIPDLSSLYLTGYNIHPEAMSGIPFFHKSGVLTYDPGFVWNDDSNMLGINNSEPGVELDVVGRARISSNLVIGNNLTVSGNLDVAGTTTYIDSTNVTIWDKQLELASMSGNATHDQLDSYIDDGGIIVRSSGDGDSDTGDKKWTWQNSSNTWRAQTSNGVPIGVTASGMVFGNGTAISGAYQGGSGISINGFNLDIGNLFSLGASPTQDIHQGDIIFVSGINGITSSMGSFPAAATATVTITDFATLNSPDKVNLIATDGTNYDFVNGDHDSVAGTWESATSNEVTATSLMNVINTSSGPAGTRFSASVVGAVVTITQNTGGPAGNTAITLTDAGSVSMTKTDFTGGTDRTHTVYVDPTHLSGILQTQVTTNATAALNRFPYASGIAHSGFFSEELHEISGVGGLTEHRFPYASGVAVSGLISASGYAISGALQYQLDNLGDVGEVNQSAFSIVAISGASPSTWHNTIISDTQTDTLVIDSGHDNSISIIPDFDNDRFVISGANQFRIGADNTPSLSTNASGWIGHNDGITISGGVNISTTLTGNVLKIDNVDDFGDPVAYTFSVQADSDAGVGGDEVNVVGGADNIEISGDSYITTTRVGDTIKIAWSGGDNTFDWFDGDPATTLGAINSATMVDADKMLVFDVGETKWKTTTLSELATEMSAAGVGDASNSDLMQASGTLDQRISDSGVAISGQLNASGQLLTNLIETRVNASGQHLRDFVHVSGQNLRDFVHVSGQNLRDFVHVSGQNLRDLVHVSGQNLRDFVHVSGQNLRDFVHTSGQNLRDYTNTRVNASGQHLLEMVVAITGESPNNTYSWMPDPVGLNVMVDQYETATNSISAPNDVLLIWDDSVTEWKSINITEMTDQITAAAVDSGDPDQNLFDSVKAQGEAQMATSPTWDSNVAKVAAGISDNLYFIADDIGSDLYTQTFQTGTELYIKIGSHNTVSGITLQNSGQLNASGQLLTNLIALKAPSADPEFTGTPTAPTAALLTNSTQIATTEFVRTEVTNLVDSAPATLNTLNELATALGNDVNFSTTVTTSLGLKASDIDLIQVSGTLDQRISNSGLAVSGYAIYKVAEASGALNDRIAEASGALDTRISNSGYAVSGYAMYKVAEASGALDQRISDSGVAVSGFCTVYTGSGVDVYAHSIGIDSRTLNLHSDWYRKEVGSSYTFSANEDKASIIIGKYAKANPKTSSENSVAIGNYAGGGDNDAESHRNTAIGYKAGYSQGTGISQDNVFFGQNAGAGVVGVHGNTQTGNICIGSQAGQARTGSNEGSIFLGRHAGSDQIASHTSQGNYNITIGSFPDNGLYYDVVNVNSNHNYNLNIGNVISANMSTSPLVGKRVKIGDIAAGTQRPEGTLEIAPRDGGDIPLYISRGFGQSAPYIRTKSSGGNYNGVTINSDNDIINKSGFLRLPIFANLTAIRAISAVDNPGMVVIRLDVPEVIYSDGVHWRVSGTANNTRS